MKALARWPLLLALLAGCGAGQDRDGQAAAGKLVARVNGTEITMQQIGSTRAANPAQALERVIDRELLVQQALEARLDRDPAVARAIEDARRHVLAQAWLERAAEARAKSSAEEVRAFYDGNPALFAERRIYKLRELPVSGATDRIDALRAELAGARDLDEAAARLHRKNFKLGPVTTVTQAAEHLPLGYLAPLARMKEGEVAVLPSGLGASVVQLVHAQDAPLSPREAAPVIEQFLAGRKRLELAAAEVKRLRAAASIEYVGDFKR